MFLIAHNHIMLPKRYFSDIVPAVEELSNTVGAVFLNKLILDENNRPVEFNQAVFSEKPLTRIVTMHFQNGDMFDQFWDARERQDLLGKIMPIFVIRSWKPAAQKHRELLSQYQKKNQTWKY